MFATALGHGKRIGNRVRTPNGTAAVCAEVMLVDESQSLEFSEKAKYDRWKPASEGASQKTCLKGTNDHRKTAVAVFAATAFYFENLV